MQMFHPYRIEIQEIDINVSFLENRKKGKGFTPGEVKFKKCKCFTPGEFKFKKLMQMYHLYRTEFQQISTNISLLEN
jgi:hypothetical protein